MGIQEEGIGVEEEFVENQCSQIRSFVPSKTNLSVSEWVQDCSWIWFLIKKSNFFNHSLLVLLEVN